MSGRSSLAWVVIFLLAVFITIAIWFSPPEYRQNVLGIRLEELPGERIINVNRIIGDFGNISKRVFDYEVPIYLSYKISEELVRDETVKLSSSIISTGSISFDLKEDEKLIVEPLEGKENLFIIIDGEEYPLTESRTVKGPAKVDVINKPGLLPKTSKIRYRLYKISEEKESSRKEISFYTDVGGRGIMEVIYSGGKCDVKIFVNEKKVFDGVLVEPRIDVGDVGEGMIEIRILANEGCDCTIQELRLILNPPRVTREYEISFGKVWGKKIRILFDYDVVVGNPNITVKFFGSKFKKFSLDESKMIEVYSSDLSETNTIIVRVDNGGIRLKKIKIIGE